jgi:hypothetical protein
LERVRSSMWGNVPPISMISGFSRSRMQRLATTSKKCEYH